MRATSVQSVAGGEWTATCHVNVDRDACQASNLAGKRTFVTFRPLSFFNFSPLTMSCCGTFKNVKRLHRQNYKRFSQCVQQVFWLAFFSMRYEYWGDKINIYIHTEFNVAYKNKHNSKKEPDKTANKHLIHPSSYLREIIYPQSRFNKLKSNF